MSRLEHYRVDNFLLSSEWNNEKDCGRISYAFTGGETREEHDSYVDKVVEELLNEHDEDYTSWVKTDRITKDFSGYLKFATVVNFRVRDAG